MFDVLTVSMNNFRSYTGTHYFNFPTNEGLYSLTGINEAEPRLGANDTGKTTFLEAIFWALYGRTPRGVKAGDVIAWGQKSCEVTVVLWIVDKQVVIRRRQSPNSLLLDDRTVTQDELEEQIRLGPEQFCYSILWPQMGDSFFDLGPTEKLNLFSDIMGLDYWLDRSDIAAAMAKELLADRTAKERQIMQMEATVKAWKESVESYKHSHSVFKDSQKAVIQGLKDKLKEVEATLDNIQKTALQNTQALISLKKKLEKVASVCSKCKQPIPDEEQVTLQRNERDFTADLSRCERALASAERDYRELEKRITEEKQRESPYASLIKKSELTISDLGRKIDSASAELTQIITDHGSVDFWVAGFKRVRLYVVETALQQLEIEVNNNLVSLGLTDWQITFDIERETKSGGVTKGFTVFIYPPGRTEPVRWEAFGGGATQRLRLAGNLGLANLIMERAGLRSEIEIYDEPSHHMSTQGVDDLLATLQNRAQTEGKKIWIIEHHSLDFAFDGQLVAIKDAKGSRLSYH